MKIITLLIFLISCGGVTKRDSSGRVKKQQKKQKEVVIASLNGTLIRNIIVKNLPQIQGCYEKQIRKSATPFKGMVTMEFTIEESGLVEQAEVVSKDPNFPEPIGECVSTVLKRIKFPKSRGGVVQVSQPFNFHPTKS
jgi:hypothetical protein